MAKLFRKINRLVPLILLGQQVTSLTRTTFTTSFPMFDGNFSTP